MKSRVCGLLVLAACGVPDPGAESDSMPAGAAPQIARTQDDWHAAMQRLSLPAEGCFQSDFPRIEWKQVACAHHASVPYPPRPGGRPERVGNRTDFAAIPAHLISSAEGSFDSVTGVTSIDSRPSGGGSEFSLQLNTKPFVTLACSSSPNPGCRGWQQFVYSNRGVALIQYWLLSYNTTCPFGWYTFTFPSSSDIYCYKDGLGQATVPRQAVSNLRNLTLGGTATAGGIDAITMRTGTTMYSASNPDGELGLAAGWTDAEFNIFGDCCGSDAAFNAGSAVTVRTTVHDGTMDAPTCRMEGFTGETNNLTLVGTPAVVGALMSPAIVFNQSNVAPLSAASCASATGTGEPHLTTFSGSYFDFQATGDFLLAQRGPDFVVQTRQVSGAPTWPWAAVNKAVATRMGKTRIALCHGPDRLEIDGKRAAVEDGGEIDLPEATIVRQGASYLITGQNGDSVRADFYPGYIDVTVGLGQYPDTVLGLLGPGRDNTEIVTRDGTVLTRPVSLDELYTKFGDSWRVPAKESLLCDDKQVEIRNPDKPFCVADLDPKIREHARGVCLQFGVKPGPALDACILDVAVLGDAAARAFVGVNPALVVGPTGCP